MSSTSNSQNLLVNVFRPVYTYSAGSGFTPKLVLSNVDILSAGAIQTGSLPFGDSNNNLFLGSNAGSEGSNNSNNVGIGVGAMQSKSDSAGTIAIGTSALTGATPAIDTIAIGNEATGGGRSNVILGARSGTLGSNMILLGSGLTTLGDDVSGKLYIGSGSLSNSLVYGDFNSRYVGINTVTPSTNLDVSGDASISRWLSVGYSPYQAPRGAVDANGYMYASLGFQAQGGSATYPAFTFIDDSGTGIYKEGTGTGRFAITSQGTKRMDISGDTLYIYANLKATGSVNIGAIDTSSFSFGSGFVRDNATTPQTDISQTGIRTTLVDVGTILQTSNGMIRVGPSSAPTVDISGSSIRAAQLYGTNFVVTPFVHDGAAGTFDLSSGNLRLNNVVRVSGTNGAIRIGSNAVSSTVDISGSNIRADGTIQGVTVTTSAGYVYAPAHSFASDLSLGLYRVGTNALGFASAGIQRMCISGGNVGIGKATPVTALEVVGDVSATTYNGPGGTAGAPHYTFSDDRTTGFFFPSANQIGFAAGGTERMRISNANIGIGTTAPTTALEISGGALRITSGTGGPIVLSNGTINISGTTVVSATGVFSNSNATSNIIGGVTLSNFDISMSTTGRILGIATTSNQIGGATLSNGTVAASNLRSALSGWTYDISTDISLSSVAGRFLGPASTSNQIGGATLSNGTVAATTFRNALSGWTVDISGGNISNSGTLTTATLRTGDGSVSAPSYSFSNETGLGLYRVGAGQLGFATGGLQRMTISNSNVGIGITPSANAALDISASGDTVLRITAPDVVSNGSVPRLEIKRGGGVWGAGTVADWRIASFNNNLYVSTASNSATLERLTILSNGNIGIGNTAPLSILDISAQNATVRICDQRTTGIPSLEFIRGSNPTFGGDINTDWRIRSAVGGNLLFTRNDNTGTASQNGDLVTMTYDGSMGINTTVPVATLDVCGGDPTVIVRNNGGTAAIRVAGSGTAPASGLRLYHNATDQGLFAANTLPIKFFTNSAERMCISGTNVGIGRTAPVVALDVNGDISSTNISNSGTVRTTTLRTADGTVSVPSYTFFNDTSLGLYRSGANTLALATGGVNRMVVNNTGVGINGIAPGASLDVSGVIRATPPPSANSGFVYLQPVAFGSTPVSGDTTVGQVVFQTTGPYYATMKASISNGGYTDGVDLRFTTNQAASNNNQIDRMTIRSFTGNVGIGTTNPSHLLDVAGTIRGSSNIVAVATTTIGTANYASMTAGGDVSGAILYSPKQNTPGNVKVMIFGGIDMVLSNTSGTKTNTITIRVGSNTISALTYYTFDDKLQSGAFGAGTNNAVGTGGSVALADICGSATTEISYWVTTSTGTYSYRNGYLIVQELSRT